LPQTTRLLSHLKDGGLSNRIRVKRRHLNTKQGPLVRVGATVFDEFMLFGCGMRGRPGSCPCPRLVVPPLLGGPLPKHGGLAVALGGGGQQGGAPGGGFGGGVLAAGCELESEVEGQRIRMQAGQLLLCAAHACLLFVASSGEMG
jgi:hypothetical protein